MTELKNLAFTIEEYRARVNQTQLAMVERGLNALLICNRANVCYLTGMENCYLVAFYAAIIPASGDPILVASHFEMLNALASAWCEEQVTFPVGADPIETICRTLGDRGLGKGRVGVEDQTLKASQYEGLRRHLPSATFVEADGILDRIKVIKTPAETLHLREAGRITRLGMQRALQEVAAGKTDNDVAAAACEVTIRAGSEFMCIEPIVTVGQRSGVPHTSFRRTEIRPGDCVLIELGACIYRYSAPQMRTAIMEPVEASVKSADQACHDCLNNLLEHLRPGASAKEVALRAKAAWTPVCDQLLWHGIYAYSVGLGFPPDWNDASALITDHSDLILQPGMCFHVTTSLRDPGRFGTAVSETVLITERGNEILTGISPAAASSH